jgi:hypothetical protein
MTDTNQQSAQRLTLEQLQQWEALNFGMFIPGKYIGALQRLRANLDKLGV